MYKRTQGGAILKTSLRKIKKKREGKRGKRKGEKLEHVAAWRKRESMIESSADTNLSSRFV